MSEPTEQEQRQAIEDILYLACDRPAMLLGVPSMALGMNVSGVMIVSSWIGMHSFLMFVYMAIFIPVIHFIMRFAFARDYHLFHVLHLGIQTKNYGTEIWGGSTLAAMPAQRARKVRDMSISL